VPHRTRSDELTALTTIAAQVNCTQDLDEILRNALQTTLDVIGEASGEIFLLDDESGDLRLHTHQGLSDLFLADEASIGPGECLCGQAFQQQQVLAVADLAHHPARTREACLREGFQSCIRLPLVARGEALGLLNIQSRDHRQFTLADQELLTAIGNQIGIAIANAQLIDDAEQRRATLDSVMNSLVDGLILLDRRGRIQYVNPCAAEMLGLAARDLAGLSVEGMMARLPGRIDQPEQRLAPQHEAARMEFTLTEPATRTVQVQSFSIHDAGGGQLGLGLLLRDITRERELDEMKSQLLSTVSHELRTPLASIKGFATTLLRQDVQWDEDSRREFLSIIDAESDRLSELIGNLLDMSRIEAGTLRIEAEPIDLGALLDETSEAFQRMASSHRFRVDQPPRLPQVLADPRRIRQVLRNLVENAVKYSPGGGEIVVVAQAGPDQVEVSVSDQGIGIAAEDLERIFDRFYQVDSASTRKVGGSGLGLSICKAIVEAHGGRIWVESELGRGSTFYVSLPSISAPASTQEENPHV
jgi:PAS domain S-box-containing protein